MEQLKSWIKSNVNVRSYLKGPSSFEGMVDIDRKRAELEDRTQAATKFVDQHLGKSQRFTDLMSQLSDVRGQEAKKIFCSAVREVFQHIQEEERAKHATHGNTRGRILAAAR